MEALLLGLDKSTRNFTVKWPGEIFCIDTAAGNSVLILNWEVMKTQSFA